MADQVCRDCGKPADPEQTMNYDDIGKPELYWCTKCGVQANQMQKVLMEKLKNPTFSKEFAKELYRHNN